MIWRRIMACCCCQENVLGALARLFGWGLAVNPFPRHWLHGKPRFPRLRHDPCHEVYPVECYVIQVTARQTG